MKKFTIALLATLYLIVTCGVSVNFHYCMGKLRGVDMGYSANDRCGKCGMSTKKSSGCCHDEAQWHKVDDNHQLANASVNILAPVIAIAQPLPFQTVSPLFYSLPAATSGHSPPLLRSQSDLGILYCVFRI
ncbi:MAG: hypothetical protein ABIX01_07060 [Chitinophagaceae bacterium]